MTGSGRAGAMNPPEELLAFLKREDKFLIVTHLNPDGDALGSAAALALALRQMGKDTLLLCRDRVPEQYEFLPEQELFVTFEAARSLPLDLAQFKNLILVDCNEIRRTGMEKSPLAGLTFTTTAVIDHHETERTFGDIRWVVPPVAATGMMIHYLVRALGLTLTEAVAVNLYTAIVVDTGNFRYENTSAEVLAVAAALAGAGAQPHLINRAINETWSEGRFKLFTRMMSELELVDGIAISLVTRQLLAETGTTPDDTESFVSFPNVMRTVRMSILLREIDDRYYKVSLRSRGSVNVARIAESFGGGGHKNAAGCTIEGDLDAVKAELLKKLEQTASSAV